MKTPKSPFEINWPLKAVDEIGLQLDSAKSTASSSNNPFDEHFRKALSSNKKVDDLSESEEKKETVDDMLNTPLILQGTIHIWVFLSKQKDFFFNITFWRNFHAVVWNF